MGRYSRSSTLLQTTLFIIIAGIIAVSIFYIYRSNQNTSESLKNASNNNKSNDIAAKKPTAKTPESTAPALDFVNN